MEGCSEDGGLKAKVRLLTIHDHPHTLDKTVNDLKNVSCGSQSLVACESVQPLQDRLEVLLSENFLHRFDCVELSKVTASARMDSLDRPRLSSLIARASVKSSSTIILTTISSIGGV